MRRTRVISSLLGLTFLAGGIGCEAGPDLVESPTADPVEAAPSFLAVPRSGGPVGDVGLVRQMLTQSPGVDAFDPEGSFYLAVHRRELGKRWFLSAYMKQFLPGAANGAAASSLGIRVVSFKIQNDKLFVFDVDDRKRYSDTFGQDVIVDAYPLVDPARAGAGAGKLKDYVLVDPAAGINQFGVIDDLAANSTNDFTRFVVELAFNQRFRPLKDGATFEQAFTGYAQDPLTNEPDDTRVEGNLFRASGVLGLALRRYSESEGFQARPLDPGPLYFDAKPRLVPNEGRTEQLTAYWNIRPGMKPIRWLISPLVKQAGKRPELQALGIDLVEVVKAGIESWNTAFGYPVLEAQLAADDDSFADDDKNYLIWDTDPSAPGAFADWRVNPNTGEIRGATVYFIDSFVDSALGAFSDQPAALDDEPAARPARHLSLAWSPFPARRLCHLTPSPLARLRKQLPLGEGLPATRKEQVAKAVASSVAHEIGHTLGLRHNFKGTLLPPSSSVMDYFSDQIAAASAIPGAYDIAAIRHLYAGGPRPTQPFCTDEDLIRDPSCAWFDEGADPLREFWGPIYEYVSQFYLITGHPGAGRDADELMGIVGSHVQRAASPADRLAAWNILVQDIRVPVAPGRLSDLPAYAGAANDLTRRLFTRLVPDPTRPPPRNWKGTAFPLPPLDPAIGSLLRTELRANLLNLDGFRSFPTRRLSVDALKRWQELPAYETLREARAVLALPAEPPPAPDQQALAEDLLARIQRAITPYFNQ